MFVKNKILLIISLFSFTFLFNSCVQEESPSFGVEVGVFSDSEFTDPLEGICVTIRRNGSNKIMAFSITDESGILNSENRTGLYFVQSPGRSSEENIENECVVEDLSVIYEQMKSSSVPTEYYLFVNDPDSKFYNNQYKHVKVFLNELNEEHTKNVCLKRQ